jgi:hypothetical protein
VINESESDQGQVLLIGGRVEGYPSCAMRKADLATGVCTPHVRGLLSFALKGMSPRIVGRLGACQTGTSLRWHHPHGLFGR